MCWKVETTRDGVQSQSHGLTCSVEVTFSEVITANNRGAGGGLEGLSFQGNSPSRAQVLVFWKPINKKYTDHNKFYTNLSMITKCGKEGRPMVGHTFVFTFDCYSRIVCKPSLCSCV